MTWFFILIVLWLNDGTPEPHVGTLLGSQCDDGAANAVADHVVSESDHKDQYTNELDYFCQQLDGPALDPMPDDKPQPHIPGKDET